MKTPDSTETHPRPCRSDGVVLLGLLLTVSPFTSHSASRWTLSPSHRLLNVGKCKGRTVWNRRRCHQHSLTHIRFFFIYLIYSDEPIICAGDKPPGLIMQTRGPSDLMWSVHLLCFIYALQLPSVSYKRGRGIQYSRRDVAQITSFNCSKYLRAEKHLYSGE